MLHYYKPIEGYNSKLLEERYGTNKVVRLALDKERSFEGSVADVFPYFHDPKIRQILFGGIRFVEDHDSRVDELGAALKGLVFAKPEEAAIFTNEDKMPDEEWEALNGNFHTDSLKEESLSLDIVSYRYAAWIFSGLSGALAVSPALLLGGLTGYFVSGASAALISITAPGSI